MTSLDLRTEFLFDMQADVGVKHDIGTTAFGRRRVYVVSGGTFTGPKLSGTVLPGGADWLVRGTDGTSELDVRATLMTDDGQLIYTYYRGIFDMSADVKERLDRGEEVSDSEYYYRTTPRFETGSDSYGWLNRVVAVGVGRKTETGIAYRVFQVL